MKKFYFCLAFACILPFFCACEKDKDNDTKTPEVKALEYQDKAISLQFKDEAAKYTNIVLTETGTAVLSLNPSQEAPATRASIYVPEYIYGTYTVDNSGVYTIRNDKGEFECAMQLNRGRDGVISSATLFLKSDNQDGVTYQVTMTGKVSDSNLTQDLCRDWTVCHTHITLEGAVKATKVFDAPEASSFNAFLDYAKEKAPQLKADLPADMTITDIMFTQTGSFIILFKNGKIFVGNWGWKNENTGELNYSWDGGEKIYSYETGKATFTVETYRKVSYYTLTLSGSVTDGGKTYDIAIAFNLEEK